MPVAPAAPATSARRRLLRRATATTGALLLAVSAAGTATWAASESASPSTPGADDAPSVMPAPGPLAPVGSGSATPQGVAAALAPVLADPALGPPLGVVVADGATGDLLLNTAGDRPVVPASTAKLATAAAALAGFGPDSTVTTRVVRAADGSIVLVGAGDPLLTAQVDPAAPGASLAELAGVAAARLRTAGVAEVRVAVDDSAFQGPPAAPGWGEEDIADCLVAPITALALAPHPAPPTPPATCTADPDPALTAGRVFAERLSAFGIKVAGEIERRPTTAADPELAAAVSKPMAAMVEQMLTDSDNTSAEMIGHLLGGRVKQDPSFVGGAAATTELLRKLGVSTAGLALSDASGLSVLDQITPLTVKSVLDRVARGSDDLWPIASGLPVAGFDGTLAGRFDTPATAAGRGDVRAKTGTLTGVSGLSGQVVSKDGQLLTFVMISNGAEDTLAARAALDSAATVLAECGCRQPATPPAPPPPPA